VGLIRLAFRFLFASEPVFVSFVFVSFSSEFFFEYPLLCAVYDVCGSHFLNIISFKFSSVNMPVDVCPAHIDVHDVLCKTP
jgi:hypothetical protein